MDQSMSGLASSPEAATAAYQRVVDKLPSANQGEYANMTSVDKVTRRRSTVQSAKNADELQELLFRATRPSTHISASPSRRKRLTVAEFKEHVDETLDSVPRYCPNVPHYVNANRPCRLWPNDVAQREDETDEEYEGRLATMEFEDVAVRPNEDRFGELSASQMSLRQRLAVYRRRKTAASQHSMSLQLSNPISVVELLVSRVFFAFIWLLRGIGELVHLSELWQGSLHTVERKYGTAIGYFFRFSKWLIIINFYSAIMLVIFLVIPQGVHGTPPQGSLGAGDIFSGNGALENSTLFMGAYSHTKIKYGGTVWDIPLAYLLITIAFFFFHVMASIYDMAARHRRQAEQGVEQGNDLYPFSVMVFAGWDHTIDAPKSCFERSIYLSTRLGELLQLAQSDQRRLTDQERYLLLIRRILINIIVFGVLGGFLAGLAILADEYGDSDDFLESFAASFTATVGSTLLPMLFWSLSSSERWDNPATTVKLTTLRSIVVKIASLYVLVFRIFRLAISTDDRQAADCWETLVGQEIYRLALLNFLFTVLTTVGGDFGRYCLDKWRLPWLEWMRSWAGPPTFQMAKSTLDVIYNQAIIWLGVFFSPLLPVVGTLSMVAIFWTKLVSLNGLLIPREKMYRVRSDDTFTYRIFILTLFVAGGPSLYAALNLTPSTTCGPFRGAPTSWSVLSGRVDTLPDWLRVAIEFLGTAGFATGLLIILALFATYYGITDGAATSMQKELKLRLLMQREEKRHLIELANLTLRHNPAVMDQDHEADEKHGLSDNAESE